MFPKKVTGIYRVLKRKIDEQSKAVQKLRIAVAMQTNGVELEQDLHSHLGDITNKMTEKVHKEFEHPDGFRCIFCGTNIWQPWKSIILSSCNSTKP